MRSHRIHVLLDDTDLALKVANALERLDAHVELTSFSATLPIDVSDRYDARLVVTENAGAMANGKLQRLLSWCDGGSCATLVLSTSPGDRFDVPSAAVGDRHIGFASDVSSDELVGRLTAMCGFRASFDRLRSELDAARSHSRRERLRMTRLDEELQSARTLQRSMRRALPKIRGAEVGVLDQAAEMLSGDFYDVARVDGSHVAVTLADVTGHGVASAILGAYVQRSLQGKDQGGRALDRLEPAEVLQQTNAVMLNAPLDDCQFVTAIHAVYDEDTGVLRWARGGAPLPILLRPGRPPQALRSEGPLLGVLDRAHFETAEMRLEPGDTVVFHTDGLDPEWFEEWIVSQSPAVDSGFGSCGRVVDTVDAMLGDLDRHLAVADAADEKHDDVTVVTLRVSGSTVRRSRDTGSPVTASAVAVGV